MLLKKLFREAGFSLTEITVALGLLGGVSIVTMKLMSDNAANSSYVRFRSEVSKATTIISTHLSDPNSCKTMLVGRSRLNNPTIPTTTAQSINGNGQLTMTTKGGATIALLRAGESYDGFSIPAGGILLARNAYDSSLNRLTDLVIVFDIKARNLATRKDGDTERIIKRITLKTLVDEPGATSIRGCGPLVADANLDAKKMLCDSLAGAATWDAGTGQCRLVEISCPYGEVPIQMTSLGSMQCVPASRQIDTSEIFDFNSTPCAPGQSVRLESTGPPANKIRAVCY